MIYNNFNKDYTKNVLELWNDEVGFIFPIDDDSFNQRINDCKYVDLASSFVCLKDNEVVGFILAKVYDNDEVIAKYINTAWISLIYVKRSERRNGIGKTLLKMCEDSLRNKGVKTISVGADLDNFFPGIPADFDNLTDVFFRSFGYTASYYTHDLVREFKDSDVDYLRDYPLNYVDNGILKEVTIRWANISDKESLEQFFVDNFYGRWYHEVREYFNDLDIQKEYLLAIVDDVIVGFFRVNNQLIKKSSYNIVWHKRFKKLCGFGPLGVSRDYRGHGIAKMLIAYAITYGYNNGYSHALIDWTGLVTYYQKMGFELWKCYLYAKKELN